MALLEPKTNTLSIRDLILGRSRSFGQYRNNPGGKSKKNNRKNARKLAITVILLIIFRKFGPLIRYFFF